MNTGGTDTHMFGRLNLQSALGVGTMVYADVVPLPRQMLVGHCLPGTSNIDELHLRGRQSLREKVLVCPLDVRLLPKPFARHLPRCHQKVGMMIANVTLASWCVNGEIDSGPIAVGQILSELPRKQFARLL